MVGNFGSGDLNCFACSNSSGIIAVSGGDRAVYAIDPRKWQPVNSWKSAIKYDANYLCFSGVDDR